MRHTNLRRAGLLRLASLVFCAGQLAGNLHASPSGETLRLEVAPLGATAGELHLIVSGGTPGETPVLLWSATQAAPVDALLCGRAQASELVVLVAAPFPASGQAEITVPLPSGLAGPLHAQAIGFVPYEPPDDPSPPLTFLGPMSTALGGKRFCVRSFAIDDPACSITAFGSDVGMFFPDGFGSVEEYSFVSGAIYTQNLTGETGALTASIVSRDHPGFGWTVSLVVAHPSNPGDVGYPPAGSPYFGFGPLFVCPAYLVANGGTIDPGTWHMFEDAFGTLTGFGGWAGARATLARTGPALQIGRGANTANLRLGMGAWLDLTYLTQPSDPSSPALPLGTPVLCELMADVRPCPPGM